MSEEDDGGAWGDVESAVINLPPATTWKKQTKTSKEILTYWCQNCEEEIAHDTDILYCRVRVCRNPECIKKIILEDDHRWEQEQW